MDHGKKGKIGDEVSNADSKEHVSEGSREPQLRHRQVHSRYEGKAYLRGTEAPLPVHRLKGLEECEDEGVAEAAE